MRIPVFAAIFFAVLVIACDAYIYSDLVRTVSKKHSKCAKVIFAIFTLLCWGLVIVTLCMPKRSNEVSVLPIMWMLFTALSIYIPKILYCICSLIGRIFTRKGKKNRGIIVGMIIGALAFIIMWWGVLVTRHQIVTNHVEVVSDKLPESFDGIRILQFSDAHVGTWGNDTTFISALVDSINAQKADLILFTGDIVNRRSEELEPFRNILGRLKAPMGVYGVYGNHDYSSYVDWPNKEDGDRDLYHLRSMVDSMGWKMLCNQTEFIKKDNDTIVLIGVENWGEPPFNQLGDLGKSYPQSKDKLQGLNDGMYKILMTHNPEHWSQVATKISNIDLSMAGHTHAMQMMLKFGDCKWSPSQYRYPQWAGMYTQQAKDGNPMHLYVNIGVGEVGFPARLGAAKPELTVFTLRSSKK